MKGGAVHADTAYCGHQTLTVFDAEHDRDTTDASVLVGRTAGHQEVVTMCSGVRV